MKTLLSKCMISILCVLALTTAVSAETALVPGGQLIGIELADGSVTVAEFDDILGTKAKSAGLEVGDRLVCINGQAITSASDVRRALERADGIVDVELERDGKQLHIELAPAVTAEGPRLGVYLKQGVTGVGTVTWYDPDSGKFGALGHGVNTPTGELLAASNGSTYEASVHAVVKGESGDPGQIIGSMLSSAPTGTLNKNTPQGIFGTNPTGWTGPDIPTASAADVHVGPATIRSTVAGNTVREYSVEILKIYPNDRQTGRNLLLKVNDPALLEITGGIVQGMSGSPIIQDGKLVGAVTHVLVNDPTTGYGIFIENMLDAAA